MIGKNLSFFLIHEKGDKTDRNNYGGISLLSGDGGFYPSAQRHYRRLIYYYIILLHVSVVRPSSGRTYINSY
jgi:hypothetical protein